MSVPKKANAAVKARRASPTAASHPARRQRVLVVDDHPMLRAGLRDLINKQPDLEVCGEAANASEALSAISRCHPDVLVTDLSMPGRSGAELIKDALALRPRLSILVVSMHDERIHAERVLRAGARGYVMKEAGPEKMLTAIRQVSTGQVYASEELTSRLLGVLTGRHPSGSNSPIEKLSNREFEVFRLLGEGLPTGDIAQRLHLSAKTVAAHRANIKTKLAIGTASELISYATRWVAADRLPPRSGIVR